jgi:hypothetical protein
MDPATYQLFKSRLVYTIVRKLHGGYLADLPEFRVEVIDQAVDGGLLSFDADCLFQDALEEANLLA